MIKISRHASSKSEKIQERTNVENGLTKRERERENVVGRVRVPASMKLNLIPASPSFSRRKTEVDEAVASLQGKEGRDGGKEEEVEGCRRGIATPEKGGTPRGARLTRHPAGSSHSYCQLPTLRPSRSSLASDFG